MVPSCQKSQPLKSPLPEKNRDRKKKKRPNCLQVSMIQKASMSGEAQMHFSKVTLCLHTTSRFPLVNAFFSIFNSHSINFAVRSEAFLTVYFRLQTDWKITIYWYPSASHLCVLIQSSGFDSAKGRRVGSHTRGRVGKTE